jgi:hypothetical protein
MTHPKEQPMTDRVPTSPVRHFAINADDCVRAQRFYHSVFGWRFDAWGPPGFFMIETGSTPETAAILGSLQQRRTLVHGDRMTGFECTIAVSDIRAAEQAVVAAGGTILMPVATIPTVGHLIWFRDTEGNVVGAMQPDATAFAAEV